MNAHNDIHNLLKAAKGGGNEETSRLLLFMTNNSVSDELLELGLRELEPFSGGWRRSKRYFFARLLTKSANPERGVAILRDLSDCGYTPAMCKLGAILFEEAGEEREFELAIDLVDRARMSGHVWAARNYWVMRAQRSEGPIRTALFLVGFVMLVRIYFVRWWYDPGELTTY